MRPVRYFNWNIIPCIRDPLPTSRGICKQVTPSFVNGQCYLDFMSSVKTRHLGMFCLVDKHCFIFPWREHNHTCFDKCVYYMTEKFLYLGLPQTVLEFEQLKRKRWAWWFSQSILGWYIWLLCRICIFCWLGTFGKKMLGLMLLSQTSLLTALKVKTPKIPSTRLYLS